MAGIYAGSPGPRTTIWTGPNTLFGDADTATSRHCRAAACKSESDATIRPENATTTSANHNARGTSPYGTPAANIWGAVREAGDESSRIGRVSANLLIDGAGIKWKWGLSFDGSPRSMPVSEFIFRLENLQRSYQVPWKKVLREFHVLMEGQAKKWYWMYVRSTEKQELTYLRYALQQQFQSHRYNFEREYELRERKQKPGETIEAYIQAMLALRSRLEMPFSDFNLIKVIKMNIRDQISRIIYPIYITNMDQLRHECHDAERILDSMDLTFKQPRNSPGV
ncbi:uncharacterized protein LOC122819053 [Drosophila biarmipes]|uniref:uncharacterized protein LOC122819053 n=1 Tax=Drosophila biarmipes TaxID=125945 RepID=UPI0007E63F9C|nr:uncharacterized protein LOC122819053 [Drosophila biarmipes]